mgnify:CR=1 FL=1
MKSPKKIYECTKCGYQSPGFLGRCPECGSFGTLEEQLSAPPPSASPKIQRRQNVPERARVFSDDDSAEIERIKSGIAELDRVLGGGIVEGSVILLAGEPGIGKSTLLMQLCAHLGVSVMYVSGEESRGQLKMRADRLGAGGPDTLVLCETDMESVLSEYDRVSPKIMIVDSVQTMYSSSATGAPGSVGQVRECTSELIARAKQDNCAVIIVGHVNKEGGIAGPKVLEHMVDAGPRVLEHMVDVVLYFEGDRQHEYRILRAVKNRFGSTNEIGVFDMMEDGLREVPNPSELFLASRPNGVSGSCATCVIEGNRPIIAEVQALVVPTAFPSPRRTADGLDYNRMCLLLAVLEKRLGLRFSGSDVYLNVVGGFRLDEPAIDAAIAIALISSIRDIPVPQDVIAVGEIGLAGEIRSVRTAKLRAAEAARLGFAKIALPSYSAKEVGNIECTPLRSVFDLVRLLPKKEG